MSDHGLKGSAVGALSPFDSRSEVSEASHVPAVPSTPRVDPTPAEQLTPAAVSVDAFIHPEAAPSAAASVVPEAPSSPRESLSPAPSEEGSIAAASISEEAIREVTPVPDVTSPPGLTEEAVEEHDVCAAQPVQMWL